MTLPVDTVTLTGLSTSQTFKLQGGLYLLAALASSWSSGSATLSFLGPDGSTYLPVGTSTTFSANGCAIQALPPGQYQLTIASATGVDFSATGIPKSPVL